MDRTKLFWVAILYFAEGFPFGLVLNAIPVFLRTSGVGLKEIGLMSLVSLPWSLKFLWAPAVDAVGSKRQWFVSCQLLLVIAIGTLPLITTGNIGLLLWVLIIAITLLSATQDIAIDAYTIQLLDEKELGMANGVRVTTYRIALITASGVFMATAGWLGWSPTFLLASGLIACAAFISRKAPSASLTSASVGSFSLKGGAVFHYVVEPFRQFLERPGFIMVALFILLFKLGDMSMGSMIYPFWVDRGFTLLEIGAVPGTVGVISTILGALLGGLLTSRWGIFKGLWVLGLFQAASNLVYAGAAALPPDKSLMIAASITESFTGGLGTAPFLAFLMRICNKSHAATQYALLSALFGLARSASGAFSGFGVEGLGYAGYFTLTFFLAFPAYVMLPWVKRWLTSSPVSPSPSAGSGA